MAYRLEQIGLSFPKIPDSGNGHEVAEWFMEQNGLVDM